MRVIAYEDAVTAARRRFLAESSISMERVAEDLAVSRATLYRVVSSQDRLLGDVLWELAERTLDQAVRASGQRSGVDRVVEISHRFERAVASFPPLQRWVEEDPLQASRVLFTPAGGIHERCVLAWTSIFEETVAIGELVLPCDPAEFAYIYVRLGETFLHGDLLAGVSPDPQAAERIRRSMFGAN